MKIDGIRVFKLVLTLLAALTSSAVFSDGVPKNNGGVCEFCNKTTSPISVPTAVPVAWDDFKNDKLGNCLLPPHYLELDKDWKRFQAVAHLKTSINAKNIPTAMRVSPQTQNYLRGLRGIETVIKDLDALRESDWFKNLYKPKGQIDNNFLKYAKSKAFLDNLASKDFVTSGGSNHDKDFKEAYKNNTKVPKDAALGFKDAVDELRNSLSQPQIRTVVDDLNKNHDISVVDPAKRASYWEFMNFFKEKEASTKNDDLARLFNSEGPPPLQSHIPLPQFSIKTNPFQNAYMNLIHNNMDDFIWHTPVSQEDLQPYLQKSKLKKSAPSTIATGETWEAALTVMAAKQKTSSEIKPDLLSAFNRAGAPAKFNLFDEKVATQFYTGVREIDRQNQNENRDPPLLAKGTDTLKILYQGRVIDMDAAKMSQVDMVARTLVGEVMDCQQEGLAQAEAVGIVIAQRTQAISRSVQEQQEIAAKNNIIDAKNDVILRSNDGNANFLRSVEPQFYGRRDFGRPPPPFPSSLPSMPEAEAVSRKNQFSVWNPNVSRFYNTGPLTKNPNIPDYRYPIFGPLNQNDIKDQIRGLCPEIPKNTEKGSAVNTGDMKLWKENFSRSKPVWDHIADLALQIVVDPDNYLKRYSWKPAVAQKDHIYFYTHGPNLPFARAIPVDTIHDNVTNQDMPLRKKGAHRGDPCNEFRAFAPTDVGKYETKVH